MEYLASLGAARSKLLMGIPFYGQAYRLSEPIQSDLGDPAAGPGISGEFTRQPGMLSYYEICHRLQKQRWQAGPGTCNSCFIILLKQCFRIHHVNTLCTSMYSCEILSSGPNAHYKDQWVGYDDIDSVKQKGQYILENGYGGAVAWTVDLDDFTNRCCYEPFPLLRSLNRALGENDDDYSHVIWLL